MLNMLFVSLAQVIKWDSFTVYCGFCCSLLNWKIFLIIQFTRIFHYSITFPHAWDFPNHRCYTQGILITSHPPSGCLLNGEPETLLRLYPSFIRGFWRTFTLKFTIPIIQKQIPAQPCFLYSLRFCLAICVWWCLSVNPHLLPFTPCVMVYVQNATPSEA